MSHYCFRLILVSLLCSACEDPTLPETTPDRPSLQYGWARVDGDVTILEQSFSGPVSLHCPSGTQTGTATAGFFSILLKAERTVGAELTEPCRIDVGNPVVATRDVTLEFAARSDSIKGARVTITVLPELPAVAQMQPPLLSLNAGAGHTCAVGANIDTYCWGRNSRGELGTGYTRWVPYPSKVMTAERFTEVATAGYTQDFSNSAQSTGSCARRNDDAVFCWGNAFYLLYDPNVTFHQQKVPQRIAGIPPMRKLIGGGMRICGITASRDLYCWGEFISPTLLFSDVVNADVNDNRTCAIQSDGRWRCGSANQWGERGDTSVMQRFRTIAVGRDFTCALDADDHAWCWGRNQLGQLGRGTFDPECRDQNGEAVLCSGQTPNSIPQRVQGDLRFAEIDAGSKHVCARTNDGRVFCWGDGSSAQLGDGVQTSSHRSAVPVLVGMNGERFLMISVGDRHACGVATDQRTLCWGFGGWGQLGSNGSALAYTPRPVQVP